VSLLSADVNLMRVSQDSVTSQANP